MDFNSLKDQVSNLTLYDVKAGVRKLQAAVMNYTEMEQKVREATNNEPWGASSTIMQEIANGTHSYQLLNEIMPMIYKRFTDKTAEEWRQIYKALQLLEFLIKNGSERVIDDARSHLSLLRMLRQFHYIDQNGKDQGINVRNRAQELAKLLNDVETIRGERKKARSNRNKFGGVEGGSTFGSGSAGGSRYGGFGSEDASFGTYTGRVYGDGGGFGGNETGFSDSQRRSDRFEEYDEGEEGRPTPNRRSDASRRAGSIGSIKRDAGKAPPRKEPEQDLFDFSEETAQASNGKMTEADDFGTLQSSVVGGDDDFDDFQSATTPATSTTAATAAFTTLSPPPATTSTTSASTHFAAPQPVHAAAANINNLFSVTSPQLQTASGTSVMAFPAAGVTSPPLSQTTKSQTYAPTGPNYFTSVQSQVANAQAAGRPGIPPSMQQPSYTSSTSASTLGKPAAAPQMAATGSDAFSSLWSSASTTAGVAKPATTRGPDLASMAKAKSAAGIWGAPAINAHPATAVTPPSSQSRPSAPTPNMASAGQTGKTNATLGGGLDDLLG